MTSILTKLPTRCALFAFGVAVGLAANPVVALADHPLAFQVRTVPASWGKQVLDAGENLILIDLSPAPEFEKKKLPRTFSIPAAELEKRFREVPRIGRVVLYCSCLHYDLIEKAVFLQRLGYRNIAVMPEGFPGWLELDYPLEENKP